MSENTSPGSQSKSAGSRFLALLIIGGVVLGGAFLALRSWTRPAEAGLKEQTVLGEQQRASVKRLTPEEEYQRGLKALGENEAGPAYELAARWFRLAADHGHVPAQFEIARLLQFGLGAPPDQAEARRYARAAAGQGFPPAVTLAGMWETTLADGDTTQGLLWLAAAAAEDDPWAQARLAAIHLEGSIVAADNLLALYWAERAYRLAPGDNEELRLLAWQRIPATSRALTRAMLEGQLGHEVALPSPLGP